LLKRGAVEIKEKREVPMGGGLDRKVTNDVVEEGGDT